MVLCSMKYLNLIKETVKMLDENFSRNKYLEHETNFQRYIVKIENILRLWCMRNLSIEEQVLVFNLQSLQGSSSIIYIIPYAVINPLNVIVALI